MAKGDELGRALKRVKNQHKGLAAAIARLGKAVAKAKKSGGKKRSK